MVYIEILVYFSVTNCNKTVYLEKKKSEREETKTQQVLQMVFIGNILYQSVTKCNKIVYLEKLEFSENLTIAPLLSFFAG